MGLVRFALSCAALLLCEGSASALTVAVVRPPNPSPVITETLVLLEGELLSLGFEVRTANAPVAQGRGTANPRAWLEELAAGPGVNAVIDVLGDAGQATIEVWVADRAPQKYVVLKVAVEPNEGNMAERLAIRAVEVLRSSLLETSLATRRERRDPSIGKPKAMATPPATASGPERWADHVGIEAGATVLMSLDGVGPAMLPLIRVDWAGFSPLVWQATAAGLGNRSTVATAAGEALVSQQFGLIGVRYHFLRPDLSFWPFFSLSAGVLRTAVDGRADAPRHGHSSSQWSFLLDGSLGIGLGLGTRYFLTLAGQVQLGEPYVAIHVVDEVAASSARPNLLLTFTLGAWL